MLLGYIDCQRNTPTCQQIDRRGVRQREKASNHLLSVDAMTQPAHIALDAQPALIEIFKTILNNLQHICNQKQYSTVCFEK